jgi:hypothetical protein
MATNTLIQKLDGTALISNTLVHQVLTPRLLFPMFLTVVRSKLSLQAQLL